MIYLDNAATTPLRPAARAAMEPFLGDAFGNPSGVHAASRRARNAVEDARERVAALLGAAGPSEIIFTGGGTESDNAALVGVALSGGGRGGVVTTAVEHEAVLETARFLGSLGSEVVVVGVDATGAVSPEFIVAALTPRTRVVSVMAANNETGRLQPVADIAAAVHRARPDVVVHTDAVQAYVSEEVTVTRLGADLVTLAAHKFGGPKGAGLLYVRDGLRLEPLLHGGGQELGRRSGTHDVAGILGMVTAMEEAAKERDSFRDTVGEARRRFENALGDAVPGVVWTLPEHLRLVQHSHLRIPGVAAETMLVRLDAAGIAASAGSACHSGAVEVSHVLTAMGMPPARAAECLRFSFGWANRPGDGTDAAAAAAAIVADLR